MIDVIIFFNLVLSVELLSVGQFARGKALRVAKPVFPPRKIPAASKAAPTKKILILNFFYQKNPPEVPI